MIYPILEKMKMGKKRNVRNRVLRVERVKFRNLFRTGAKVTSPGSFVYIDVPAAEKQQAKATELFVDNEFYVSDSEANAVEDRIDSIADSLRNTLLGTLSSIAGFDKASGQIEAIARDVLETDVEHDNSVQDIIQTTAQLDVLCYFIKNSTNIPKNIRSYFMKRGAAALAETLPSRLINSEKLQRHRQYMDNVIAVTKQRSAGHLGEGPYITGKQPKA